RRRTSLLFVHLIIRSTPRPPLFPYTTLFRSYRNPLRQGAARCAAACVRRRPGSDTGAGAVRRGGYWPEHLSQALDEHRTARTTAFSLARQRIQRPLPVRSSPSELPLLIRPAPPAALFACRRSSASAVDRGGDECLGQAL